MEDLAHFIQSMSEKYGLLDASNKQAVNIKNNNNNNNNQQQQHLQDHTSSAASNTLNSEECQGSSWECLSIFISGSQSIDCNTLQSAGPHHALPALNSPKKQAPRPQQQTQTQQDGDNKSVGSPPLHSFSKLIDIDEHKCPLYNASKCSTSQQQRQSPDQESSHLGASSTIGSKDLVDNCGDLSTVVTNMSDYVPQCYYQTDNNNDSNTTIGGTHLDEANSSPGQYFSKNTGQAQLLQQPAKNHAIAAISPGNSTHVLNLQELHVSRGMEGPAGVVPYKDFKDMLLHPRKILEQEDATSFEQKAAMSGLRQGPEQIQQFQHASNRSRLGRSSTSVTLNPEAESGEYVAALHEYDISSGWTSRDLDTYLYTDAEGYCHEVSYDTDPRENFTGTVQTHLLEGRSSSRGQCHGASQSCSALQSYDRLGERRERGVLDAMGCNCSSTEMSPRHAESCHHNHQRDEHGATASTLSSLEYLPVTSAMQSRVAQLDEASKELFASRDITTQSSNQLNLTVGQELRQNCSSSSDKPPALKKARSFKDFSHGSAAPCTGKEETDPKSSMPKDNTVPSMNSFVQLEASNSIRRPGVLLAKLKHHPDDNPHPTEESKGRDTWKQDEDHLKAAETEARGGAGREPKWSNVNKLLCENGFSSLDWQLLASATDVPDKFFHTLHDVLRNYGRREQVVQELLAERDALCQEEKRGNEIIQKVEYEVDLLKRKLATSEQRAELANAAAEKAYALLRKDNQRLEASHASMLQRCSQLEHGSRAKERALRKLQEKIQEAVQRKERQRQKERELYEKLKHKVAIGQKSQGEVIESNFLLRDLKPATIVGIYERQRAAAQVEMKSLRDENSRLCQELCEKENSLLSKMQAMSTADERERVLSQQLTEIDDILKTKTSRCQKLAPRGDTALLPLAVNQTEDLKKEITNLQVQLESCPAEGQSPSKSLLQGLQMDAAQVSRKKLDLNSSAALLASNLNSCTSSSCQEFQQGILTQLKVADPVRITAAIDGLLKVVAAVPRMEKFIEQVCDIVFNDGAMILARETQETPEAVPGILRSWLDKMQAVEDLQQFKDSVSAQLWERFDEKAPKHPMSSRVAAASVKDLIDIERQYLLSQASYREGEIVLKAEPQKLLHCIIKHFQMLFEIPRLEGVMAVMNSVYIQISEYHNFARALCSMLGLPKDARPTSIISTVTSIVNKG